eukprot:CAMPEP_0174330646 /NCGR_PEP_ID=MMETSP0810-20121108/16840_1 /TAXON_ID=73025 ORGANISM="Eutreptiella gymnastica-like, Strain CCMP1594" /NCGR_SAMPLE_ID=MMETSP0810 /ASSEMBLY_ACC=CAM_ASM_000659 /LENGTH=435 /DNA_ID=CAMNT_0015445931 /DNA_START=155 /DNA_END=1462 /DNA_ORIENTATION=+
MAQLSHVDQFATSAESWSQMWRLYDILDRNGDGVLSSDDWPAGSDKWQMLQSRFDINGDNKITRDEFVYRLKLMAYEQPIDARLFPAMPTNHAQCLEELTRSANYQIQVLCKQLFEAVSDSLGPPANVQKVSDSQGATSPPPAAKVSVQLVTYQFRGGAPPHRGFHRQGQLQVHNFDPTTSVKYVKAQISPQDRVLVCKPGEQLPPSPTEGAGFQDLPTEGIVKDCLPEGSFLVVLKSMQMGYDIGVFEQAVDPNTHFLVGDSPSDSMLTPSTVKQLISSKGADPDAAFRVLPSSFVPPQARRVLVEHLEREHAAKPEEDLKLTLSHAELAALIGTGLADDVVHEFGKCDKIRLRRCEAHGKSINLHTDFHRRTMQVPLNGDDEYDGGKLVYVNKYGLHWPRRAAGSATVHDNTILHGVSELKAGVRYSLFLQEE